MARSMKQCVVPLFIVAVGVGWLLNALTLVPGVDWAWTLGLAAVGVAVLARGFNKATVVVGPFLVVASVFSVARQTGNLSVDVEVPCLVITFGALLLVQVMRLPLPKWLLEQSGD